MTTMVEDGSGGSSSNNSNDDSDNSGNRRNAVAAPVQYRRRGGGGGGFQSVPTTASDEDHFDGLELTETRLNRTRNGSTGRTATSPSPQRRLFEQRPFVKSSSHDVRDKDKYGESALSLDVDDSFEDDNDYGDDYSDDGHAITTNGHHRHGGHHHGTAPGSASPGQVAANIVISFVGAGLLGLPNAFAQAGWLLASVTLGTVAALNVYGMLLLPALQKHLHQHGHHDVHSYGTLGRYVLGPHGEHFVNICLGISQAGFATAYLIFMAANLSSIWPHTATRAVVCIGAVPGLALLVQARDMSVLAPFSLLADVANLAGLSAVLLQDWESYVPHNDTIQACRWEGFLYIIAITIYSMEGVGLILSLEASCHDRGKFPGLFKLVLTGITTFMAFFGTAGYLAFGDNTQAPITLNLHGHWAATFVKCSLCLALYLTYPVMMFPIWSIVEGLSPQLDSDATARRVFRTMLVMLSALVAYAVPDFGKFLSLVGSSICTILGFILPCYFHVKLLRSEMSSGQIALDVLLIGAGSLFAVVGTYQSFINLVRGTNSDGAP